MLAALLLAALLSVSTIVAPALAAAHRASRRAAHNHPAQRGSERTQSRHTSGRQTHRKAKPKLHKRAGSRRAGTVRAGTKRTTATTKTTSTTKTTTTTKATSTGTATTKSTGTGKTTTSTNTKAPTRTTTATTKAPVTGTPTTTTAAPVTTTTATPVTTTTAAPTDGPESSQWFSPTSIWRAPLATQTPVAADSASLVSSLATAVNSVGTPWINSSSWSTPIYTVPLSQPDVTVTLTEPNLALQEAFDSVPLPANAQPAAGSDMHLVVWQPSTDTLWEFWKLQHTANGTWTAGWGGMMDNVSGNPGYYSGSDALWGATATSLPLLGGLITIDDLQRGQIDHALAMAVPNTAYEQYVWPAQRSDGYDQAANAIPEGTEFRIPASVDLASLNLPPVTLELAQAAQTYGIYVRDTAGNVAFYAEDPAPTGSNPYGGFWGASKYPSTIMRAFPWSLLQVVDNGPVTHAW